MVKRKGDYELVDNPKFDIESGIDHNTDSGFEIGDDDDTDFPPSSSHQDEETYRSRFDELTKDDASACCARKKAVKGFTKLVKRRKKVFIALGVVSLFWFIGVIVHLSGGSSMILDYYKNKIGATGNQSPEVENNHPSTGQKIPTVEAPPTEDQIKSKPEEESQETHKPNDNESTKQGDDGKPEGPKVAKKRFTMDQVTKGAFYVRDVALKFIPPPANHVDYQDEGLYYFADRDGFYAMKAADSQFKKKLNARYRFVYKENTFQIETLVPNYDLTLAIVKTNSKRLFRHSSLGQYWLFDLKSKTFTPLTDNHEDKLSYARWSPNYNYISIVKDNNIYIKIINGLATHQITHDGSDLLLNGRTDWVYEEEVMAVDQALWWAPDESKFIFMKTNDSNVPEYNIDYFVQTKEGGATKYPISKRIAYPKPGFANPKVSLHVFDLQKDTTWELDRSDSKLGDEAIIYEVFFVDNENAIIKETDRESNILNFRNYNTNTKSTKITYEVDAAKEYNGWIEKFNDPLVIPPGHDRKSFGFVDILVVDGYNHLVFFKSADSTKPITLTSGKWEVTQSELSYNPDTNTLFFSSNQRSSIDTHVYSMNLNSKKIEPFLDNDKSGHYESHFSPSGKYVSLNYQGPETPNHKIFDCNSKEALTTLSDPTYLNIAMTKYEIPTKTYHRIKVDDNDDGSPVELNVIEILPANFDKSKKHPLLVHFYSGPGSQVVTSSFSVDFEESIASSLDAVVLYIEPRGTGGQGWKFRSWANKRIGYWEPRDIVKVTEKWISENDFIDTEKTALWGWSYGGFTTLKTLEYDAGKVFKYGMAVAPVTNWLFYDSIYTERYMNKPQNNEEGYKISQISNVKNLGESKRFLIMHGTADDNVHIQNTYSLLDLLDVGNVRNYDVHVFPDSEHSIYYHNANSIVYGKLSSWLKDAFDGDFDHLAQK